MSGVEVCNVLEDRRIPELLRLYQQTWWAGDRDHDRVVEIVTGSDLVFSMVDHDQDQLVGFARVLTDRSYIALLLDVIVTTARRGNGFGALLMDAIIAHPTITPVETVELVCPPELVSFYSRWGFSDRTSGSRLLRRTSNSMLLGRDGRPVRIARVRSRRSAATPISGACPGLRREVARIERSTHGWRLESMMT